MWMLQESNLEFMYYKEQRDTVKFDAHTYIHKDTLSIFLSQHALLPDIVPDAPRWHSDDVE